MSEIIYRNPDELTFVQSRATVNDFLVAEYAEMMADDVEFDPVSAMQDEAGAVYVWDGYHRGRAAMQAGKLLAIRIEPGTRQEAEWLALSANQKHGLRRSNMDKRKVVVGALQHPNGVNLSDREIAQHCGVSHPMVGQVRKELEVTGKIYQSDVRTGADGRTINTAKIGAVAVWELERALRAWLGQGDPPAEAQIDVLANIKTGTPLGRDLMEQLLTTAILPRPRRKGDVIQAVNNVLEQMRRSVERGAGSDEREVGRALEVLPGEVCFLCGRELDGSGWPAIGVQGRFTCEEHRGQTIDEYWADKQARNDPPSLPRGKMEQVVMCPRCDEAIFPEQDLRADGSIVCDACKKRFASYEALLAAAEKAKAASGIAAGSRSETQTACPFWTEIPGTAERCYICGLPAGWHNNGRRGWPGADLHLCGDHYWPNLRHIQDHTREETLRANLERLKAEYEAEEQASSRGSARGGSEGAEENISWSSIDRLGNKTTVRSGCEAERVAARRQEVVDRFAWLAGRLDDLADLDQLAEWLDGLEKSVLFEEDK